MKRVVRFVIEQVITTLGDPMPPSVPNQAQASTTETVHRTPDNEIASRRDLLAKCLTITEAGQSRLCAGPQ